MSRHIVSNYGHLNQIILKSFTSSTKHQHRLLIVIETSTGNWLQSYAKYNNAPYIASSDRADRADRITALLGHEYEMLVHEIGIPMDAGLLAALTGTIKAGGVLVLGISDTLHAPEFFNENSTASQKLIATISQKHANRSGNRFHQRFKRLVAGLAEAFPSLIQIARLDQALPKADAFSSLQDYLPLALSTPLPDHNPTTHQEQAHLLGQARRYLSQTHQGSITITGKRGRGKSTLLAQIANWLHQQNIDYQIFTANPASLASFHQHLDHTPPECLTSIGRSDSPAPVLLVDEAGNMPLASLSTLTKKHAVLVFCTTVEGYESAGRAFDLRFIEHINQMYANPLHLQPQHPWRWSEGDPLEQLMESVVLNSLPSSTAGWSVESTYSPSCKDLPNNIRIRLITQDELVLNEPCLKSVFGLLRETHYQTTVQDLQHLLDGPGVQVWAMSAGENSTIVGILLASLEGTIDLQLHDAIIRKQRRLQHQLLPQLLAQMANSPEALPCRYARIIRISVTRSLRRLGLGSRMLEFVETQLFDQSAPCAVHATGASFASDPVSIAFWQANKYTEFHRGFRQNPRTGTTAVAVIKTPHDTVREVVDKAASIHIDNQKWHRRNSSQSQACQPAHSDKQTNDTELLSAFAAGHRSANDTYAALARLQAQELIQLTNDRPGVSRRSQETKLRQCVANLLETNRLH